MHLPAFSSTWSSAVSGSTPTQIQGGASQVAIDSQHVSIIKQTKSSSVSIGLDISLVRFL